MSILKRLGAGESIFYDFGDVNYGVIDAALSASYTITDANGVVQSSGALAKSSDSKNFELRVADTVTASFNGRYSLEVYLINASNGRKENIYSEIVVFS